MAHTLGTLTLMQKLDEVSESLALAILIILGVNQWVEGLSFSLSVSPSFSTTLPFNKINASKKVINPRGPWVSPYL